MSDSNGTGECSVDQCPVESTTFGLRMAIENLKRFSLQNTLGPIPHIHQLDVQDGRLIGSGEASARSVVGLARCFVAAMLSDSARKRYQEHRDVVQREILKAIDIVKSSYPLLSRLKEGDESQRKLADRALQTIEQYNAVVRGRSTTQVETWGKRLVRFLLRCSGLSVEDKLVGRTIVLPLPASQHCRSPEKAAAEGEKHVIMPLGETLCRAGSNERISSLFAPQSLLNGLSFAPTHREADAFRMKAITMIRNYGFPSTSLGEVLQAVRLAPLRSGNTEPIPEAESTVVTFQQTLEPFPGETIILEGSFRRSTTDKVASIPIPDSFRLYSKSSQTGFPHPLQHNGWGLCDKILPPFPDAIEQVPLYRLLHEHKRKVALGLLPSGRYLPQAKRMLQIKRSLYEEHRTELLSLHKNLALSMCQHGTNHEAAAIVERFFDYLDGYPQAIELLAQLYATVTEYYMTHPSEGLQPSVVRIKTHPEEARYRLAAHELEQAMCTADRKFERSLQDFEQPLRDYALLLGRLLREPSSEIILQYMSEKIGYRAPELSSFAQHLQINALRQLMTFLVDVEMDFDGAEQETSQYIYERIVHALEEDIACFEEPWPVHTAKSAACVAKELGAYYTVCRLT